MGVDIVDQATGVDQYGMDIFSDVAISANLYRVVDEDALRLKPFRVFSRGITVDLPRSDCNLTSS